jgi:GlcNAc-P-P-Und epimerase
LSVLITGGSGFIGSRLVSELATVRKVRIFDKVENQSDVASTCIGDVRDVRALNKACEGVRTIYHLAAEHRDNVLPSSLYREVNVTGTKNLTLGATATGVEQIIFTSTVAVYGLHNPAADENATPEPFNEYGRSKLEAEELLKEWANAAPGRSLVIVRPCVVFGEGNRGNVYNLLRQIYLRRFLMIGPGTNKKSLAYVGNIARFLARLCEAPSGIAVLNYADKPDLTTRELVAIADKYMGTTASKRPSLPFSLALPIGYCCDALSVITRKELPISSVRVRKFCAETSVSSARLDDQGFCRPFTLEEGLARTILAEFPSESR